MPLCSWWFQLKHHLCAVFVPFANRASAKVINSLWQLPDAMSLFMSCAKTLNYCTSTNNKCVVEFSPRGIFILKYSRNHNWERENSTKRASSIMSLWNDKLVLNKAKILHNMCYFFVSFHDDGFYNWCRDFLALFSSSHFIIVARRTDDVMHNTPI